MDETPTPQTNESNEETDHTPGPWFSNPYRAQIQTADPSTATYTTKNKVICYLASLNASMPVTSKSDARLMAAAPDLLDSLKEMLNQYSETEETGWRKRMHDDARAAISKAEGKPVSSCENSSDSE